MLRILPTIVIVTALVLFWWASTFGTWSLFGPPRYGFLFDSLAQNLLHGGVEAGTSEPGEFFEVNRIDGRTYIYFGPFPALIRALVFLVADVTPGALARLSCLLAAAASLAAARALLRGRDARVDWILLFAFAFGSPLAFLVSVPRIYHEAILWGLAAQLWCAVGVGAVRSSATSPARALSFASLAAGVALLSRATFGLGAFALLAVGTAAALRRGLAMRRAAPSLLPALLCVGFQLWYNAARFGSPLAFVQSASSYIPIESLGGMFAIGRLPDTLRLYLLPERRYFDDAYPFVFALVARYSRPELFMKLQNTVVPITISAPWMLLGGMLGLRAALRSGDRLELFGLAALLVGCLPILGYFLVTERFTAELAPFAVCATALSVRSFERPGRAVWLALALWSAVATTGSTVSWLLYGVFPPGQITDEWRSTLRGLWYGDASTPGDGRARPLGGWVASPASEGRVVFGKTVSGRPIFFGGKAYENALGVSPGSIFEAEIPPGAKSFSAVVDISEEKRACPGASMALRLESDAGTKLVEVNVDARSAPRRISLGLDGSRAIRFIATDGGTPSSCDALSIVEPRFLFDVQPGG